MSFDQTRGACDDIRADLSEFALGTLVGRSRSEVLEHVAQCEDCRANAAALATVADAMLALAPTAEPPAGFELGLVQRWRDDRPRRLSRSHHRVMGIATIAAALVAVGFALAVAFTWHPVRQSADTLAQSAVLTSAGQSRGHVWISAGTPSWIYMSLDDGHRSGTAWCSVTLTNGHVIDVGVFTLTRGYGAWSSKIDTGGVPVAYAVVTDASGAVLARGRLTT